MTLLPEDVAFDLEHENARLRAELHAAREHQAASAEILRTIGGASGDAEQSLHQIAETTKRLVEAASVSIFVAEADKWGRVIHDGANSERVGAEVPVEQLRIGGHSLPGAVFSENRQIHLPDINNVDPAIADWPGLRPARAAGTRTLCGTPLRRAGQAIGVLVVHRDRLAPFTSDELALLQTFADQAVIAIENTRLFNETREALERQTATADILKVIASSPSDVQPVFEAIAELPNRLIGGHATSVLRFIEDRVELVAFTSVSPEADAVLKAAFPIPLKDYPILDLVRGGEVAHVFDTETETRIPQSVKDLTKARGLRSFSLAPLIGDKGPIGVISVSRKEPGIFAPHHVQLLQTFADQAVIAIQNTRLFNETKEALERQTATADILKVIAGSPSDVQPVFEAIARSANMLIGGFSSTVFRFIDGVAYLEAFTPTTPAADEVLKTTFPRPVADFPPFRMAQAGEVTQVADTEAFSDQLLNISRARGFRSMLFAPLMNEGVSIGFIAVTRVAPGAFADHHVQLLRTFADQAVIAIENARLFNEVQAKTRDLTEALTYQTGSSNILSVIASSPTNVEPVLKAIVESACELCDAYDAFVRLRNGDNLEFGAHHGPIPITQSSVPINRGWTAGLAVIEQRPVHIHDLLSSEGDEFPEAQELGRSENHRTILSVPLMRKGESIGAIVLRRTEVHPFTDKQIALLQTFADQAVIAISNVGLFEQVQARTRELTESLQFQTASADVLEAISRSPDALQPVFDVIVETSRELCRALASTIFILRGDKFYVAAFSGIQTDVLRDVLQHMKDHPIAIDQKGSALARAAREKRTVYIPNTMDDPEFAEGGIIGMGGPRATLTVPLMRDGEVIGGITLRQSHLTPFTPRQIEAIESFADQAEIAISNVGLFEQVQERTRELSKSLDDLRTAQDRLIQTEKLASLGQLTAGIAHEIKNPLNFVNNFSALSAELTDELNDVLKSATLTGNIREEVDELTRLLKDNLQKVVQHGKRADSIVKNMLLHSREGSGDHRPADINALVDESLNLAYHGARAEKPQFNVTLKRNFDPNAGLIEVFPQEITRVFLNLISNGFYAVTKRKADNGAGFDPVVSATTRDCGDHVEIRIRDNGTGIPPHVKEKMFNPFFTTKPAGEGTGLGLSMSHDIIVKQHGGTIDVVTEPGQFTEFTVVLPRTRNLSNKT